MSMYARYKRSPEGFRQLVELMESTPVDRRQKMIDAGMKEDPFFLQQVFDYMLTFQDIVDLPEDELAEVISCTPGLVTGKAISGLQEPIKTKFLRCAITPKLLGEIRDALEMQTTPREAGGAQLKMIASARACEKKGKIKTKRIPLNGPGSPGAT